MTDRLPSSPPGAAVRLLAACLPDDEWRQMVLGDLHEEHAGRVESATPWRAALWYWLQTLRLVLRFGVPTIVRRFRHDHRGRGHTHAPGDSLMRRFLLDVRYALRAIRRRPGLSAIVVTTLAFCVGANAAVFAIVDALVLRPFPFRDIDRLAVISTPIETEPWQRLGTVAPADFLDWRRESAATFDLLTAFDWWDVNLVGRDQPERVQGFRVSPGFFPALDIQPVLGRMLAEDEDVIGRDRVAVIGYGLWRRRFGGDPGIIGRAISLDGRPYEIVGVAPQGFDFPMGAELWTPLAFDAAAARTRTSHFLTVVGRLAPGRTLADAGAEMAVIGRRLQDQYPDTNQGRPVRVHDFSTGILDTALRPILGLWQAAAIVVLLIGCANVANLLLAIGATRQRELAVRIAMGATRARLVRELLVESLVLAGLAVPAALGIAWAGLALLRGAMPAKVERFVPGWSTIDVDGRLIAVTAVGAVMTAIVFGILPALQASKPNVTEALKDGARGTNGGRQRARRLLVVAEMTLALPLLVASGMASAAAYRLVSGPQGYDPDRVLSLQGVLPDVRYGSPQARRTFADGVLAQAERIPGVEAAAIVNVVPSTTDNAAAAIEIEGVPALEPAQRPNVDVRAATPSLFDTLGVPMRVGRGFTTGDYDGSLPVAIVSESLARQYWPGRSALGRRLRLSSGPWLTVVGVCGDVIHDWFTRRNYPTVYQPYAQAPTGRFALLLRTSADPAALAAQARAAVSAVDPDQPVFDVMTMRSAVRERTIGLRYIAAVMGVFGGLALVLAVVGIYSVMAYFMSQRRQEIGVRIALGASRSDVIRLTVGQAGRLTAAGLGIGTVLSIGVARLVEAGLAGTAVSDVRILLGFVAVLGAAALAAGYLPARRAAAIDPVTTLRG